MTKYLISHYPPEKPNYKDVIVVTPLPDVTNKPGSPPRDPYKPVEPTLPIIPIPGLPNLNSGGGGAGGLKRGKRKVQEETFYIGPNFSSAVKQFYRTAGNGKIASASPSGDIITTRYPRRKK